MAKFVIDSTCCCCFLCTSSNQGEPITYYFYYTKYICYPWNYHTQHITYTLLFFIRLLPGQTLQASKRCMQIIPKKSFPRNLSESEFEDFIRASYPHIISFQFMRSVANSYKLTKVENITPSDFKAKLNRAILFTVPIEVQEQLINYELFPFYYYNVYVDNTVTCY